MNWQKNLLSERFECFAEKVYSYFNNRRNEYIPKNVKMPKNILYTILKKKRNNHG